MIAFPYYGGKSCVADEVWERFGDPDYYYEPFAGGLGVLLARPNLGKYEYISDADGFITNFWRAAKYAPDDVAFWADDPPNSLDLVARIHWLREQTAPLLANLRMNPDYCDAKLAGWWAWCQCTGININNCGSLKIGRCSGVHRERQRNSLYGYFRRLAERLDRVTIYHGDWTRLARAAIRTAKNAKSAILLDPPYTDRAGRRANLYATDSLRVGFYVQRWALAAASLGVKVALCGYAGEYDMPASWEEMQWQSLYGKGRERIWFSP